MKISSPNAVADILGAVGAAHSDAMNDQISAHFNGEKSVGRLNVTSALSGVFSAAPISRFLSAANY